MKVPDLGAAAALAILGFGCLGPEREPVKPESTARDLPPLVLITIDTLRSDHMSIYGYPRATTPRLEVWAKRAATFSQAYTYWPKTRGSFVAIMTGKTAGESGYSPKFPELHGFNATLAETLQKAGYETAAFVDNANVAGSNGFSRGFTTYVEMWADLSLKDEVARTEAITRRAVEFVRSKGASSGYFLWLHYVNPHAPYTPPSPFDQMFTDRPKGDPTLKVVDGFVGGVSKQWAIPGKRLLSDYVNAYDGEIAYSDTQVDAVFKALEASGVLQRGIVILTSDHGESLGEHNYYFDHGANLFDPVQKIPFLILGNGVRSGRSEVLISSLDIMPTLLDAAHVSFPSGLFGRSALPFAFGRAETTRATLVGANDRGHQGVWDRRFKLIDEDPLAMKPARQFFDREADPREAHPQRSPSRASTRYSIELDEFRDVETRSALRTRSLLDGKAPAARTAAECEQLKALGYVAECR